MLFYFKALSIDQSNLIGTKHFLEDVLLDIEQTILSLSYILKTILRISQLPSYIRVKELPACKQQFPINKNKCQIIYSSGVG